MIITINSLIIYGFSCLILGFCGGLLIQQLITKIGDKNERGKES